MEYFISKETMLSISRKNFTRYRMDHLVAISTPMDEQLNFEKRGGRLEKKSKKEKKT